MLLESFLHVLRIFYEEAEGEDERQTEAEKEARAGPLPVAAIDIQAHEEEDKVSYGLVELPGMTGHLVYTLEDESPWHLGNLADYLRVHQVAQTYEARRNGGGYGYIVEHLP